MPGQLIIMRGLPASGKTTRAFELVEAGSDGGVLRVNKDDLRTMLHRGRWSYENEVLVLAARDALIAMGLARGLCVISDDTNLTTKHMTKLHQIAQRYSASVKVVDFTSTPIEECIARDAKRTASVGEDVIRKLARIL